jgi:hypothetical protein
MQNQYYKTKLNRKRGQMKDLADNKLDMASRAIPFELWVTTSWFSLD